MSENPKVNNENGPSCLHCSVHSSKQKYQEIFDEVGIEIELADLLAKYFQIVVKPDAHKSQLLCQECVNTLIRFFDIDELQRQQDAANAAKKAAKSLDDLPSTAKKVEKSAKKATPTSPKTKSVASPVKNLPKPETVVTTAVATTAAKASNKALTVLPKRLPDKAKEVVTRNATAKAKSHGAADQEQISALIRDILDDEEPPADDKFADAAASVRQLEKQTDKKQIQQETVEEQLGQLEEEDNNDELEFLLEQDDNSSDADVRHFKVERKVKRAASQSLSQSQSQNESQSEDESFKVEPFNFVLIKESDNIGDLHEYLSTVVKTCFETLQFNWATVCRHCSLKCSKYETLLSHMQKCHQLANERYSCPIEGCTAELQGRKYLAMHLVVLHAPVAEIPIYGKCPECNMTFSNILQYNKHSCAHVIKKRRGMRLYCEMCGLEFPSWKRFNFHNQFHLERHRPRACFVCDFADNNIDELFRHLYYAHEPEGTLFCDLCDRNFRDAAVFMEHNKSHANVSSTTYSCSECSANFETRGRLNGHLRSVHGSVISCELCSREFATEATYNLHMKTHLIIERQVHVCSGCGLLSDSKAKLQAHVEAEDSACFGLETYAELLRNAYVCEYCSAYFKQKSDLRAHRDSGVHKDGFFICHPCDKAFADMKLYRHHLRNFQQQRSDVSHRKLEICLYYMCDYEDCAEAYINWNSLYTHKRRSHDAIARNEPLVKENEWICQFCQKQYRSKMSLSVHVARSHNNNNVVCPLCKASYKDNDALTKHHAYWHEPMECSLCLKVVKNRRNYDTHMNVVHSNNKRYSCSVCQKGFYHKSEMEAHQRLHNQSYSCDQCSFVTRNKKSLSVHVLGQHFKRFAFECKACNKRFGRRQGLSNHMQRVHGSRYTCHDFFDSGCSKSFSSTTQLKLHVRKAHNGSIYVEDDTVKGDELDELEEQEQEQEQEQEEEQEQDQEEEQKEVNSDGPSSSKKRCIRINANTQIEFIGNSMENKETEMFEELHEPKSNKRQRQK
ncbi:zinc finger protein 888 [Drosophila mojavensis]|uniref:zinc finger protein 888 n=1 Tax=Drosophila mojavensis TaxID=7230 RepID=UPI001CD18B8E|nr:zinc finger protein 888 [Drosophila mojavensis]